MRMRGNGIRWGPGMSVGVIAAEEQGTRGVLSRAAHGVVDCFATVFPERAEDMGELPRGVCLLGCSCFHGPVAGLVSIAAPMNLCEAMIAGMSGSDGCCEEAAASVLGELANMIASQVALELEPAEAVMMTPPTVERSTYADWITIDGSRDSVRLNVDGWPLLALLSMQAA